LGNSGLYLNGEKEGRKDEEGKGTAREGSCGKTAGGGKAGNGKFTK
jgi:hypothetical protein